MLPFQVSLLTGLWFRRAVVKVGASEQHLCIIWKLRISVSWASVQHFQMSKDEQTQWSFRRAARRIFCVVETGLWSPATVLPRILSPPPHCRCLQILWLQPPSVPPIGSSSTLCPVMPPSPWTWASNNLKLVLSLPLCPTFLHLR